MDSLQKGQEAVYTDEEDILKVRVLKNNSDKDYVKYDLEVVRLLKERMMSRKFIHPFKIGDHFSCIKKKGHENLWFLTKEGNLPN